MPFVTHKPQPAHKHTEACNHDEPVLKAIEDIVDPDLLADIEALSALYTNAITGLGAALREARRLLAEQGRTGNLDLRLFQEVFASRALEFLRQELASVSAETANQVLSSARISMENLPKRISANISFDNKDPRAIEWANQRAGAMIQQIEAEALQTVRNAISNVLSTGGGVPRAAKQIERVIGLHPRWQQAVNNFYNKEVARFGRTMSPDSAVIAAQETALAYQNQLIRARALNIARTEILAAQNIGQLLSWYQAADAGFVDLARAEKEWVAGPSGWKNIDVCPICEDLEGQRVPVLSVFTNGEISPPAHPNCRCTMNLIAIPEVEETDFVPLSELMAEEQ